ncbi:hypothetical protein ACQB60_21085 [Actinomycetota bacterium Odt1-20B]
MDDDLRQLLHGIEVFAGAESRQRAKDRRHTRLTHPRAAAGTRERRLPWP